MIKKKHCMAEETGKHVSEPQAKTVNRNRPQGTPQAEMI